MFPDKLCVSSFPNRFPHSGIVSPLRLNDRGFLRATAVTRRWNGHRMRVSTQSEPRRKKFARRFCRDSNSHPFDHESGTLTNKLSSSVYATHKTRVVKKVNWHTEFSTASIMHKEIKNVITFSSPWTPRNVSICPADDASLPSSPDR